jgi:flagellar biosynthesis protein FlhB
VSGEKTEAPTERRRSDARRKGQGVGRSHELAQVMTLVAGLLALSSQVPGVAARLEETMRSHVGAISAGVGLSPVSLLPDLGQGIQLAVILILPIGVAVMIAGVLGSLAGGGFILSLQAINFQASRMNPISGLKRLADKSALQRLGINLAKLGILAAVSWQVISSRVPAMLSMDGNSGGEIAARALSAMFELGVSIALLLATVALVDWVLQRRRAQQSLRMTKEEVKQEYKQQEGDPLIRAQRRARARAMAFGRMMDDVARADVVVVNPIRLAVALRYDPKTMRAPVIVGKGQRLMAARIREVARLHNIPIIEDVPLARALYPRPVGAAVPADLYRAVARILVLVAKLRNGTARTAPRRRATTMPAGRLPSWFEGTVR